MRESRCLDHLRRGQAPSLLCMRIASDQVPEEPGHRAVISPSGFHCRVPSSGTVKTNMDRDHMFISRAGPAKIDDQIGNSTLMSHLPRKVESQTGGLIPAQTSLYMPDIWAP
ncbi:N,N-dimethylglycine oxidase [Aspergillus luchuensis]|uniref:N,N-dimethylglycine oxidase n=1 Tax=Aspergillus kawachii TaxID=1069201 RepID=A0A146F4L7_ASPKA|nr:N,N-dimethylglycine oxidase [Aspergillus luchuensis]